MFFSDYFFAAIEKKPKYEYFPINKISTWFFDQRIFVVRLPVWRYVTHSFNRKYHHGYFKIEKKNCQKRHRKSENSFLFSLKTKNKTKIRHPASFSHVNRQAYSVYEITMMRIMIIVWEVYFYFFLCVRPILRTCKTIKISLFFLISWRQKDI